ncbi:guanylate kinase [Pseudomonas fluorescens]|uniref:guanylate kinase n=1 Tax=Pseudomonas TaxID=286 RepID=UPI000F030815|nr:MULTISPECIES: guanylate kinase [Pseudomonas]MBD8089300.1 guanylate kinase [Pseudomonas fluorescens]MBD8682073.1 guanylate kinase [Pseudomonas sp. CFBP 13719]
MIITLSGMSTSGKTYLAKALSDMPQFSKAVSVTTRPMRDGEADGVDYHFVSTDEFKALIDKGEFLEYEASHKAMYGTAAFEVERILARGSSAVLVLEPEGVVSMERIAKERGLPFVSVYIETSMPVIMERFVTERMFKEMETRGIIDFQAHADRLDVILSKESLWPGRKNWDLVLKDLHLPGRFDQVLKQLVELTQTRDMSIFGEVVQPAPVKIHSYTDPKALVTQLPGLYRQLKHKLITSEDMWKTLSGEKKLVHAPSLEMGS